MMKRSRNLWLLVCVMMVLSNVAAAALFEDDFSTDTTGNYNFSNAHSAHILGAYSQQTLTDGEMVHGPNGGKIGVAQVSKTAQLEVGETLSVTIEGYSGGTGWAWAGLMLTNSATYAQGTSTELFLGVRGGTVLPGEVKYFRWGAESDVLATAPAVPYTLGIERTDTASYSFYLNDTLIGQTVPADGYGAMSYIGLFQVGNFATGTSNTVVFDDLKIVPEPSTMILLGVGSVMSVMRRRRTV